MIGTLTSFPSLSSPMPCFNETSVPVISFFSASAPKDQIRPNKIPFQDSKLINRMNHHLASSACLGILPNAFRSLLTLHKHQHKEEALHEIMRSLFFAGYRIWPREKTSTLDSGGILHRKIANLYL